MLPHLSSATFRDSASSLPQPKVQDNPSSEPQQPRPEDILPEQTIRPRERERSTSEQPHSVFSHLSMPGYPFLGSPGLTPSESSPLASAPFSPRPQTSRSGLRTTNESTLRGTIMNASKRLGVSTLKQRDFVNSPSPPMLISYSAMPGNAFIGKVPSPTAPVLDTSPAHPTSANRKDHSSGNTDSPMHRPTSWVALSPNESQISPTPTMPVEPKTRARDKNEEIELQAFSPVPETVTPSGSSMQNLAAGSSGEEQVPADVSSSPTRKPSTRFPFNRMTSFWGWEGPHMLM